MSGQNQFSVFCLSLVVGFTGGLLYEFFSFFRLLFGCREGKNVALGITFDVFFGICLAVWCIFGSFVLRFPSVRLYIIAGYGLGLALYLNFLHRIVAFLENVCYNVLRNLIRKCKKARKNSQKEGDKRI